MLPPPALELALAEFDRGLRVRWAEGLGRWCVERHHGYAGSSALALVSIFQHWKLLEAESDAFPDNLELDMEERVAHDLFVSRRAGFQPILYLTPSMADQPRVVIETLAMMDIRRAGGPEAYVRKVKAEQERQEAQKRRERHERVQAALEEAFDRVAVKKDFHAQGGNALFYPLERDNRGKAKL